MSSHPANGAPSISLTESFANLHLSSPDEEALAAPLDEKVSLYASRGSGPEQQEASAWLRASLDVFALPPEAGTGTGPTRLCHDEQECDPGCCPYCAPPADKAERGYFAETAIAFLAYFHYNRQRLLGRFERELARLPARYRALLADEAGLAGSLAAVERALRVNSGIFRDMAIYAIGSHGFATAEGGDGDSREQAERFVKEVDHRADERLVHELRACRSFADVVWRLPWPDYGHFFNCNASVLQLYREWSDGGRAERECAFGPAIDAVNRHFDRAGVALEHRRRLRVVCPGSGLGRIVYEFAACGYSAAGVDNSYLTVLQASFMLNGLGQDGDGDGDGHGGPGPEYDLYPFLEPLSNLASRADQLQRVRVPDERPGGALARLNAQLAGAGAAPVDPAAPGYVPMAIDLADFAGLYGGPGQAGRVDALVTVFFLDCLRNPFGALEAARNCVRPGGVWVNLGPLVWPAGDGAGGAYGGYGAGSGGDGPPGGEDDAAEDAHVPLTSEEVVLLLPSFGFRLVEHGKKQLVGYGTNMRSLCPKLYSPTFWVAVRV